MAAPYRDAEVELFFASLLRLQSDFVTGIEELLVAGGTVGHVFPVLVAIERIYVSCPFREFPDGVLATTAFAVRIRIAFQNRDLKLLLDSVPLLFWRFRHVKRQNIILTRIRFVIAFSGGCAKSPFRVTVELVLDSVAALAEARANLVPAKAGEQHVVNADHLVSTLFAHRFLHRPQQNSAVGDGDGIAFIEVGRNLAIKLFERPVNDPAFSLA